MTSRTKTGVECAERLITWIVFDGDSTITAGELKQIIVRIFGEEIAGIVQQRTVRGETFTPIEDE